MTNSSAKHYTQVDRYQIRNSMVFTDEYQLTTVIVAERHQERIYLVETNGILIERTGPDIEALSY